MTAKSHFKHKETWENYDERGIIEKYKISCIVNNIPNEVKTILDVGCGNGVITNVLSKKYEVTGVDFSSEALKYLECSTICCSTDEIPVEDNSYDMVFSSQMLEHLTIPVLEKTISEFKRITKKYIFITVPHNEFLDKNFTKCPKCGHILNVSGHLQSFSFKKLQNLFIDEYKAADYDVFGAMQRQYNKILLYVRQNLGNRYFNPSAYTFCENCENTDFPIVKGNLISKLCNGLNLLVSRKKLYWMLMIFEKKNPTNNLLLDE